MTTGIKFMGKDPDGNAKPVSVNANGEVATQLSGSKVELYGSSIDDRPAANEVPAGATFTVVDDFLDKNWISDGTNWMEV